MLQKGLRRQVSKLTPFCCYEAAIRSLNALASRVSIVDFVGKDVPCVLRRFGLPEYEMLGGIGCTTEVTYKPSLRVRHYLLSD